MVIGGNLLTHYNYRKCAARVRHVDGKLHIDVDDDQARVSLAASISDRTSDPKLPPSSIFTSAKQARRCAGPLPYTFDYEKRTHGVVTILGKREKWAPRLVDVSVGQMSFFEQPCFEKTNPRLASAFYLRDIPYRWERGVHYPLTETQK
jgi:hypothetical protein